MIFHFQNSCYREQNPRYNLLEQSVGAVPKPDGKVIPLTEFMETGENGLEFLNGVYNFLYSLPEKCRIMVIGEPDTGKSTLVAALASWFYRHKRKTAVVDCDVGQADIGPPGSISYGFVERPVSTMREIVRRGSYVVGGNSPYNRLLPTVAGAAACCRAAEKDGADVIILDTSGLVRPFAGVRLKCAKVSAVLPDLVIVLETPGVRTLIARLKAHGYQMLLLHPLPEARIRSVEERQENRVSRWNLYLKDAVSIKPDLSRVRLLPWWADRAQVNVNSIPRGTVLAVPDPHKSGLQVSGIWVIEEDGPKVIAPLPEDYRPTTMWVTGYRLTIENGEVVRA